MLGQGVRMGSLRVMPGRNRLVGGQAETVSSTCFYRFSAFTMRVEIELKVLPGRCTRVLTHGSPDF
jgi:hypothetical protein